MIIKTCPYGGDWVAKPLQSALGNTNIIALHVTKSDFVPTHTAPLSVKYVWEGAESYYLENRRLTVDRSKYVIINCGQPYASKIDSQDPTYSLCVFFSETFVQDGFRCMTQSGDRLLDHPEFQQFREINFYQKMYWQDESMEELLAGLCYNLQLRDTMQDLTVDDWCSRLLELLFRQYQKAQYQCESLQTLKSATRQELYRRLSAAVDFLHEYFYTPVRLQQLNDVSCLSSFYFIRVFKQAFKVTPHQYLTALRLQHACYLLKKTRDPISNICYSCGFQSESSFARLFRVYHGVTPTTYRSKQ